MFPLHGRGTMLRAQAGGGRHMEYACYFGRVLSAERKPTLARNARDGAGYSFTERQRRRSLQGARPGKATLRIVRGMQATGRKSRWSAKGELFAGAKSDNWRRTSWQTGMSALLGGVLSAERKPTLARNARDGAGYSFTERQGRRSLQGARPGKATLRIVGWEAAERRKGRASGASPWRIEYPTSLSTASLAWSVHRPY